MQKNVSSQRGVVGEKNPRRNYQPLGTIPVFNITHAGRCVRQCRQGSPGRGLAGRGEPARGPHPIRPEWKKWLHLPPGFLPRLGGVFVSIVSEPRKGSRHGRDHEGRASATFKSGKNGGGVPGALPKSPLGGRAARGAMRVAFALESPLRYGGGVSMVVRTLMESLPASYRFLLISPDEAEGLRKDPLWGRIEKHFPWRSGKNPPHREFYRTMSEVLPQLVAAQPDLVHFHSGGVFSWGNRWPGASWPATLRKHQIPCVWTNHLVVDLFHGYCGDRKSFWFKLAMLPLSYFGKCHQLVATSAEICVSDHDAKKIRCWYFPFRKKISRIYHSRIRANEIALSSLPREKMILAVGHLAFRKGQHILVQAFAKIHRNCPDWRLVLLGPESTDGCGEWIKAYCRENGLGSWVTLAGDREDPRDWMKRCSVFVQPSLQEALGLALQEALACGCACVGTKAGGIPELVLDRVNGRLVDPGDIGQLAEALQELLEDENLRSRYGLAGVKHIQSMGINRRIMVNAHDQIYRRIFSPRSP